MRVELTSSAWKAEVIPIYDARVGLLGFEPRLNLPKRLVLPLTLQPGNYILFISAVSFSRGKGINIIFRATRGIF